MIKKYFLTGATGAIGSALIPCLLEDADCLIWMLVRADSDGHLNQRIDQLLRFWALSSEQSIDVRRLIPVRGDTDQPGFGLSEELYAEISTQCTHIIHCAGVVRMNLPLNVARQHALGAARNLVEMAVSARNSGALQKIEYVSTVGVGGRMTGAVPEAWITQSRDFHNTYEQSKAEAEDYLCQQIELHDLPVTIHRPSMVVGDSKTGQIIHFQVFYYLCEFLSGRNSFGILPYLGKAQLDTVPVDYVAKAITWSAGQQHAIGKIFHLCSGSDNAIQLSKLQCLVRSTMLNHGIGLPRIVSLPSSVFSMLLRLITWWVSEPAKRALKVVPVFIDYLSDRQSFATEKTKQYFKNHSGPLPVSSNDYLSLVMTHYLATKKQ